MRLIGHIYVQIAILSLFLFLTSCAPEKGEPEGEELHFETENIDITGDIPQYTVEDIIIIEEKEIGSCTTPILDKRNSRVNNIHVASRELDGLTIEPGEEFSFNETLGKRTKKKGYKPAPIFIKKPDGTTHGYGVGGGICQVSSTLYGAVLEADLKVTERHPHSKRVKYVEPGRDATVVYGGADFKFVNTRDNAIVIKTKLENDRLTIKIFEKIE